MTMFQGAKRAVSLWTVAFTLALSTVSAPASSQIITTIVGGGPADGTDAMLVGMPTPLGIEADASGNVYVAVHSSNQIIRIAPDRKTKVIVGTGSAGFSGDGDIGTNASISRPYHLVLDGKGGLIFCDTGNQRIRRVDLSTGIVMTIAGTGAQGFGGDGGPATNAMFNTPTSVALDAAGNLYVSDHANARIRRIDAATGVISTVAGNGVAGFFGDGGLAINARIHAPQGLAFDRNGSLFIADSNNYRIRRIDALTGIISTVAGTGVWGGEGDGGPAIAANMTTPTDVILDASGNLYISDYHLRKVRVVDSRTGIITTLAGTGGSNLSGDAGPAVNAELSAVHGLALDGIGNLYLTGAENSRVRKVNLSTGIISTIGGNGLSWLSSDGGPGVATVLAQPYGVAADADGTVYVADVQSSRIRKLDGQTQLMGTLAGNTSRGYSGDGLAVSSSLYDPHDVVADGQGSVYLSDHSNHRVRRVDLASGRIFTVAGIGVPGFSGDGGPAVIAAVSYPWGLTVDRAGNLYFADAGNHRVRKVDKATGIISTVAGNGVPGFTADGALAATANLSTPTDVAVDINGDIFISDQGNFRIRKVVAATGLMETYAGNGVGGYGGERVPATQAALGYIYNIVLDGAGNLFMADASNQRVRRVAAATKIIETVAGNGIPGFSGDGSYSVLANLNGPTGLAIDGQGNLLIADSSNNRVRKVAGLAVPYDLTPPVITSNITGTLGTNGWYTGAATVQWTVTDGESSISSRTGCDTVTVHQETSGLDITCTASSSGGQSTKTVTIKRDGTAPVASSRALPIPNASGWNSGSVTVEFTGTDALSGVASCTAPKVVSAQGTAQSAGPGTCTDNAGNVSTPVTHTGINIDLTAPTVSGTRSPAANAAGWNKTDVTVAFTGTDPLSGVAPDGCSASVTLGAEGAGQSASGSCDDRAGNTASVTVTGVNIDKTPPTAMAEVTPAANANGWHNAAPTISFVGTDSMTGSGIANCTAPTVVAADGVGQSVSGSCSDLAGNASVPAAATVSLDRTLPVAVITLPADGATYGLGAILPANYACSDGLSGVASCSGTVAKSAAIPTGTAGLKTFTLVGIDKAGNSKSVTVSYSVSASFDGGIGVSTTSLAFGNQVVLTSSAGQTVTVLNSNSTEVGLKSILFSGTDAAMFGRSTTCTATLAAGASCTVTVFFRPTAQGAKTGSLVVTTSNGASRVVSLTGAGLAPALTLSATGIPFGNQPLNTTATARQVTLTNSWTEAVRLTGIVVTGTDASQFSRSTTCGASLGAGASCVVNVFFRPTTAGLKAAQVTLSSAAAASPQSVALSGTGVALSFSLSTSAIDFGNQTVGRSSAARTVTITNTGSNDLAVRSLLLGGTDAGSFARSTTCTATLVVGASCNALVYFKPLAAGVKAASLSVAVGGLPTSVVTLAGAGL